MESAPEPASAQGCQSEGGVSGPPATRRDEVCFLVLGLLGIEVEPGEQLVCWVELNLPCAACRL